MKKITFVVAAAAASFATSAHAEAFNGPFFGVEAGHDNFELKVQNLDGAELGLDGYEASLDGLSGNGAAGGLYAGYDYSMGSGFIGIEGNISLSNAKLSASVTDGVDTAGIRIKANESYGVAARLGLKASDNVGIYAKGGWTNTRFKATLSSAGDAISEKETEDAIVYGAGLQAGLSDKLAVRVEYTVVDYGKIGLGPDVKLSNSNVRAGLTYSF